VNILSDTFPIRNGLKQGEALLPLLFIIVCHQEGPRKSGRIAVRGTHQLLVYVDDVNLKSENIKRTKRNTEVLLKASKEVGIEVNTEEN
jgi:hypothetical protein